MEGRSEPVKAADQGQRPPSDCAGEFTLLGGKAGTRRNALEGAAFAPMFFFLPAFQEADMVKTTSGNKGNANDTGKSGNASGSNVKEARGPSYDERHGKHPPNKIYTGPKEMHPHKQTGSGQSDKG